MQSVTKEEYDELVLSEREFLHDLSNHLVVAQGMANIVLRTLSADDSVDPKVKLKQEKALTAINEQIKLIKGRRTLLHSKS